MGVESYDVGYILSLSYDAIEEKVMVQAQNNNRNIQNSPEALLSDGVYDPPHVPTLSGEFRILEYPNPSISFWYYNYYKDKAAKYWWKKKL
jgi:hypothetical protein